VGHHEPVHVWDYRHSSNHSIDYSDVQEFGTCFLISMLWFADLESHPDWAAYDRQLESIWSSIWIKYMLPGDMWTVETAKQILAEMKMFYDPPFNKDPDCKCTINLWEHELTFKKSAIHSMSMRRNPVRMLPTAPAMTTVIRRRQWWWWWRRRRRSWQQQRGKWRRRGSWRRAVEEGVDEADEADNDEREGEGDNNNKGKGEREGNWNWQEYGKGDGDGYCNDMGNVMGNDEWTGCWMGCEISITSSYEV
jgi:hypothetical protein